MGKVCKENISPISVAIFEVPGCMVVFVVHGILRPLGRELFPEIFRGPGLDRRFGRVDALHARISSSVLRLPLRIVEQLVGEFYPTAGPGCLVIQNGAASFLCRATEYHFQDVQASGVVGQMPRARFEVNVGGRDLRPSELFHFVGRRTRLRPERLVQSLMEEHQAGGIQAREEVALVFLVLLRLRHLVERRHGEYFLLLENLVRLVGRMTELEARHSEGVVYFSTRHARPFLERGSHVSWVEGEKWMDVGLSDWRAVRVRGMGGRFTGRQVRWFL
mmetsp:Transcript_11848/g.29907  ORF Transcript_11848/g.29907 Transcript_11848/m.29907 type:complete len:276 (+) Transcript_11848:523-1350(+)